VLVLAELNPDTVSECAAAKSVREGTQEEGDNTMRILAIGQLDPTKDPSALMAQEGQRVYELYDSGLITDMYWKADNSGAALILEADSLDQAREQLGSLPMVQHGMTAFTYIPITPLASLLPRPQGAVTP